MTAPWSFLLRPVPGHGRLRRLMHIDPYSLDRVEGFGENLQPYRPFPQRRHGHGTRSRNLPCRIVRHRGRLLPEPHPTPPARLWWATGTDERLRGAVPGSRGTVAQRRAREKRARHHALCTKTSEAFVPYCAHPECVQPSPETPVGSLHPDPRRRG